MMSDIQKRLARVKDLIAEKDLSKKTSLPQRYTKMANQLGGEIVNNFAGSYCLVKTLYDFSYLHGSTPLKNIMEIERYSLSAFTTNNENSKIERLRLRFFDTETTGLGGTGTVPFLIGIGSFIDSSFEIRQYIIPDYSDETAMLEDLSEEFGETISIVSYNGSAFDLPIMRDRLILNRVAKEIKHDKHIDLLHPVRRLYKRRLKDCSLTNVEREIFSFYRENDIPGYLVPSVYFTWLNEDKLEDMEAVMEHNRLDILTLAFLMDELSSIFQNNGESLDSIDDLHSLSKIHIRRKNHDRSLDINNRITGLSGENLADDILLFNARIYKKSGEIEKAVSVWERLKSSNSRHGIQANIELAMYFEHKKKDYQNALKCAQKAYKYQGLTERHYKTLGCRVARLLKKITN